MGNQIWNRSLLLPLWGAAVFFILGFLFADHVLLGWADNTLPILLAKLAVGIGAAVIYYALCIQPAVPIGYRGVVELLNKRVRVGPAAAGLPPGRGLLEGINATPLPRGLMTVLPVDVREGTMELGPVDEYASDNNTVTVDGSAQWRILDPYQWVSINNGEQALMARVLQGTRDVTATRPHLAIIREDKVALSDAIQKKIMEELRANRADPDKETLVTDETVDVPLVQIRSVRLPTQNNVALNQVNVEIQEREAERLQAESRLQQVNILTRPALDGTPSTIDRRLAYMGSLADAGKQGVNMTHFSADETLVASLTSILTAALTNLFRNQTPPAPPAPPPAIS